MLSRKVLAVLELDAIYNIIRKKPVLGKIKIFALPLVLRETEIIINYPSLKTEFTILFLGTILPRFHQRFYFLVAINQWYR